MIQTYIITLRIVRSLRIITFVLVHLVINSLIGHQLVVRGFLLKKYLREINSFLEPIKPDEYSLCTHIDSNGKPIRNDGLCPAPLKCEARQDKYVCSCGFDKYFDEKSNDCCEYRIRRE